MQLLIGFAAAGAIAAMAARARALTSGGAIAATVVGAIVYAGGGLAWSVILIVFFLTSSALSRLLPQRHLDAIVAKSARRDAKQVLANGGVPAAYACLTLLHHSDFWLAGFAAAVAAAAADTWATEIGPFSAALPILITSGHPVRPGTSGGITRLGTLASAGGAAAVAGVALATTSAPIVPVFAAGLAGSLLDSLLGATIQELRFCPACGTSTEQSVHSVCGTPTNRTNGIPGFDNDAVNAAACAIASLLGMGLAALL